MWNYDKTYFSYPSTTPPSLKCFQMISNEHVQHFILCSEVTKLQKTINNMFNFFLSLKIPPPQVFFCLTFKNLKIKCIAPIPLVILFQDDQINIIFFLILYRHDNCKNNNKNKFQKYFGRVNPQEKNCIVQRRVLSTFCTCSLVFPWWSCSMLAACVLLPSLTIAY